MKTHIFDDVDYGKFKIRIKHEDSFTYTLYITEPKWKRVRAMQGYKAYLIALKAAKDYIDQYGHRHLDKVATNQINKPTA